MAKNWAHGLPDEGLSPKSGHPMAAEGMPFPWRRNGGKISTKLEVIWEMSDSRTSSSGTIPQPLPGSTGKPFPPIYFRVPIDR